MNPLDLIDKYYEDNPKLREILLAHSKKVTEKALNIAGNLTHLNPDLQFIEEAAMLHDIGVFLVNDPEIYCTGDKPYICHGYLGRELLEKEGYPEHALVAERHTGSGLSIDDIERQKLPVPIRDMQAVSLEEEIISFSDLFFSKIGEFLTKEKPAELIREQLSRFGAEKVRIFDEWVKKFG